MWPDLLGNVRPTLNWRVGVKERKGFCVGARRSRVREGLEIRKLVWREKRTQRRSGRSLSRKIRKIWKTMEEKLKKKTGTSFIRMRWRVLRYWFHRFLRLVTGLTQVTTLILDKPLQVTHPPWRTQSWRFSFPWVRFVRRSILFLSVSPHSIGVGPGLLEYRRRVPRSSDTHFGLSR